MSIGSLSTNERIRGRQLQEIRRRFFAKHPLCVECERKGRVTIATELDHIKAIGNGGIDNDANRQGLCLSCHQAKTRRDFGKTPRKTYGADGWPINAGGES